MCLSIAPRYSEESMRSGAKRNVVSMLNEAIRHLGICAEVAQDILYSSSLNCSRISPYRKTIMEVSRGK